MKAFDMEAIWNVGDYDINIDIYKEVDKVILENVLEVLKIILTKTEITADFSTNPPSFSLFDPESNWLMETTQKLKLKTAPNSLTAVMTEKLHENLQDIVSDMNTQELLNAKNYFIKFVQTIDKEMEGRNESNNN